MITDVAPYKLIDIGANLTNPCLNDRNLCDVVDRAKAAGIHPHDAKYFNDESIAELEKLALEPECVAIGECGLDFNRNFSPQENQLTAFEAQVQLACKLKKTIFIHERDAHSALVEILKKYSLLIPYAVVHCFTGTAEQAKTYLDMGLYIGLTGSLWKDKLEFGVQYALRQGIIPLNRLLVETDSPYMYPNIKAKKLQREVKEKVSPHALQFLHHCSFQRNEPCALPTVVELIAAFSGASVDDVAINTTLNAVRLFGLTSE
ncbi:Tat-linked quality control protein TatD [Trichinella spiralis]|uniref:Deoxyribonuclease TATDN1 n=1 Tax=Trichinella spiralis TaxID=6334 RepID=A0A0V1C2G2_TRISP|nr:Tat-linked quality control protein TatD [Trichinella spiralis]